MPNGKSGTRQVGLVVRWALWVVGPVGMGVLWVGGSVVRWALWL